jgi:phage/plasmid primase-like uncharacterized protein
MHPRSSSNGTDLRPFFPNGMAAWQPDSAVATGLANALNGTSLAHPEIEFTQAARAEGVEIEGEAIGDGKIHRVPHTDSKRGERDAWYVLFTDGDIAGGAYGTWNGLGATTIWRAEIGRKLTFQEEANHHARMERVKEDAKVEREVHAREAAERASDDVARWVDATNLHPYLSSKGVKAYPGTKTDGAGRFIIPYQGNDGKTKTYQSIGPGPEFAKRFLKDGAKKGTFFEIRGKTDQIYICEGYATAASVHEATGATVIVAGDAGSLLTVAQIHREQFISAQIFIAADNDAYTLVAGAQVNTGLTKGGEAAKAVRGVLLFPTFSTADVLAHPKGKPTDFNDLAMLRGIEAVREQITATTRAHTARADFEWVQGDKLEIKDIDWLVEDYIEANSLAQLFGESGCGKSFVVLDIACCIATGKAWLGREVQKGAVFYICGEGHGGIARRLRAWEQGNNISLDSHPFYKSVGAAQLSEAITINRNGAAQVAESIRKMVELYGVVPVIVIVDTLSRNYGGDENSTEEMAAFIQNLDEYIRKPWNCTVIAVHHSGAMDKDRSRGSTALRGALDAEYKVSRDASGVITIESKKMKDADLPQPVMLRLQKIELRQRDGSPVVNKRGEPSTGVFLIDCTADVSAIEREINTRAASEKAIRGKNKAKVHELLGKILHQKTTDGELVDFPLTINSLKAHIADSKNKVDLDWKAADRALDRLVLDGRWHKQVSHKTGEEIIHKGAAQPKDEGAANAGQSDPSNPDSSEQHDTAHLGTNQNGSDET